MQPSIMDEALQGYSRALKDKFLGGSSFAIGETPPKDCPSCCSFMDTSPGFGFGHNI